MTQQYLRTCKLTLGDPSGRSLDVSQLRIAFQIQHAVIRQDKTLFARIYNMAPQTIAAAPTNEGGTVTLQVGYQGDVGTIFQGDINQTRVGRESQVDTYFDVFAIVGDQARTYATVNTSLAAGYTDRDVRSLLLKAFGTYGFASGVVPDLSTIAMPRGRVFYGMAADHMDNLARDNDCTWHFEDGGQLNMVSSTGVLPGPATVLTAATGMVGLPQQTEYGIAVRCLINPLLRLGGLIQLDNATIQRARQSQAVGSLQGSTLPSLDDRGGKRNGFYKIISIDYVGDTRGQEWYCDLICMTTDPNGVIPNSVAQSRGV